VSILAKRLAAVKPSTTVASTAKAQELKAQGLGIFLIEHDIHNVMNLCDRASVMKNGQLVGTVNVGDVTDEDILGMIIMGKKPAKAA
jgi:D-xylose transport system ATP-binding protein